MIARLVFNLLRDVAYKSYVTIFGEAEHFYFAFSLQSNLMYQYFGVYLFRRMYINKIM